MLNINIEIDIPYEEENYTNKHHQYYFLFETK